MALYACLGDYDVELINFGDATKHRIVHIDKEKFLETIKSIKGCKDIDGVHMQQFVDDRIVQKKEIKKNVQSIPYKKKNIYHQMLSEESAMAVKLRSIVKEIGLQSIFERLHYPHRKVFTLEFLDNVRKCMKKKKVDFSAAQTMLEDN